MSTPEEYDAKLDLRVTPLYLIGSYWFRAPSNFMKYYAPRLPPIALNVYIYLCYRVNEYSGCWPSVKRMSRDLNLSRSSIHRALKYLVEARLVQYEKRHNEATGAPTSNFYLILPARLLEDEMGGQVELDSDDLAFDEDDVDMLSTDLSTSSR